MEEDLLTQGIAAVKAGNKPEARRLLDAAIRKTPDDIRTWGWFYNVCENDRERLRCLQEILRIDPNNQQARQRYDELARARASSAPAAPKAKARGGPSGIQIGMLAGLSLILVIVLGVLGARIWSDITLSINPPTESPTLVPATSTRVALPSATPRDVPTPTDRTRYPTWTPLPTNTPWPTRTYTQTTTPTLTKTPTTTRTLTLTAIQTFTPGWTSTTAPSNTRTSTKAPTITGTPPTAVPPTDTPTPRPGRTPSPTP